MSQLETIRYRIDRTQYDKEIGLEYRSSRSFNAREKKTLGSHVCSKGSGTKMGVGVAEHILKSGQDLYKKNFHDLLGDNGYRVVDNRDAVFANQTAELGEISIGALIRKAYFERCKPRGISETFNKTKLTIEWKLFDNLSRKVIYSVTTEGNADSFNQPPIQQGNIVSFDAAFLSAATELLNDDGFADAVQSAPVTQTATALSTPIDDLAVVYGDQKQRFIDQSDALKRGTVTIRSAQGHGSGFFVSDQGHVLTNHHVVAGSPKVLVITTYGELDANIIASDPARDVALLKLVQKLPTQALKITRTPPKVGEQIYVAGTPLDERLSFSVTRGIVSGMRNLQGLDYIQTDAAVNPGNSGGPVLDEYGNVVAMSVSGLFNKAGGSLNTNFLIPIEDALRSIGLQTVSFSAR
ncbi:MAG: S1C family serine protease [Pseudomonadales bacterium]